MDELQHAVQLAWTAPLVKASSSYIDFLSHSASNRTEEDVQFLSCQNWLPNTIGAHGIDETVGSRHPSRITVLEYFEEEDIITVKVN